MGDTASRLVGAVNRWVGIGGDNSERRGADGHKDAQMINRTTSQMVAEQMKKCVLQVMRMQAEQNMEYEEIC